MQTRGQRTQPCSSLKGPAKGSTPATTLLLRLLAVVLAQASVFSRLTAQGNVVPGLDGRVSQIDTLTLLGRRGPAYPNGDVGVAMRIEVCNPGSVTIPWQAAMAADHPKLAFLIVRVTGNRIEQISGRDFCAHAFLSQNVSGACGTCANPGSTSLLGMGCTTASSPSQNGDRLWLGPPAEINPWLGTWLPIYSYFDRGDPDVGPPANMDGARSLTTSQTSAFDPVKNRVTVKEQDLLSPVGQYFYGVQLIHQGEAVTNRGDNLASRGFNPTWTGSSWLFNNNAAAMTHGTILSRWPGADIDSGQNGNDDGRFFVAARVTPLGGSNYHYEYAVQNVDNSRAGATLRIPIDASAVASNYSFRDIDQNPLNDWAAARVGNEIVFTAPASNPLEWNTIYNFGFDCDVGPADGVAVLDQARPGPGALSVLVAAKAPLLPPPDVVINEVAYDDPGADDEEFVEIYNASPSSVNLSGWTLVHSTANLTKTPISLPAMMLAPGARIWVGSPLLGGTADFPSPDYLENDFAALRLVDQFLRTVDAVAWEHYHGSWTTSPAESTPIFAPFVSEAFAASPFVAVSWSRLRDGYDTDNNALDFHLAPQTRGISNDRPAGIYPYNQNCNGLPVGSALPEWGGSKLLPTIVVPATPSPDGQEAASFATAPGGAAGGSAFMLLRDVQHRISFDSWVFIDSTVPTVGERAWSIGVRGTTDPEYQMPDPVGLTSNNGDVGLCWTYVANTSGVTLYLIDKGDGGRNHVVLKTIPITTSNDGWRRLRLEANSGRGIAYFDGTVGQFDGFEYPADILRSDGNIWVGVRSTQPGFALVVDGMLVAVDEVITEGVGAGCQGNCPRVNPRARVLATARTLSELGLSVHSATTYRIELTPNTGTNSSTNTTINATGVRVFTAEATGHTGGLTATVTVAAADGSVTLPNLTLTPDDEHEGWYTATFAAISVTGNVFVDFHQDGSAFLPIAEYIEDDYGTYGSPVLFPAMALSPASTITAGWAVELVCTDTAGNPDDSVEAILAQGKTTRMKLRGGTATSPAILVLSLAAIPPLPLAFLGAPGCSLYPDPAAAALAASVTNIAGSTSYGLAIPLNPSLMGVQAWSQWLAFDPLTNPFNFVFSNALRHTVR